MSGGSPEAPRRAFAGPESFAPDDGGLHVAVVGGGPAGASAAYHLARRGWRVAILERATFPREKACGDGLTPGCVALLAEMGVLERLRGQREIAGATLLTSGGAQVVSFPSPGLVVPRHALDAEICRAAVRAGAALHERATVVGPLLEHGRVAGVRIRDGQGERALPARFVVAADGGTAGFARRLGLHDADRFSIGYALRGYYAGAEEIGDRFAMAVPLRHARTGRMLAGYGWIFPMRDGLANLGVGYFALEAEDLEINARELLDGFLRELPGRGREFGQLRPVGRIMGGPLRSAASAFRCVGPGVLLAGDAAGLVDPFTGEGIRAALHSGMLAAEVLDRALASVNLAGADLRGYAELLELHYRDRFSAGRRMVKSHGFTWKVMDGTAGERRPVLQALHRTTFEFGLDLEAARADALAEGGAGWNLTPGLAKALQAVRQAVLAEIRDEHPSLVRLALHLLGPAERAIRPALLFSAALPGGGDAAAVRAAAGLELAHLAALVHDDVAPSRPGGLAGSAQADWGNKFCIGFGDYLTARCYRLLAEVGTAASLIGMEASEAVAAAQLRRALAEAPSAATELAQCRTQRARAAAFTRAACRIGARLAGLPEAPLTAFGARLGVALALAAEAAEVSAMEPDPARAVRRRLADGPCSWVLRRALAVDDELVLAELCQRAPTAAGLRRARAEAARIGLAAQICAEAEGWRRAAERALGPAGRRLSGPATESLIQMARHAIADAAGPPPPPPPG